MDKREKYIFLSFFFLFFLGEVCFHLYYGSFVKFSGNEKRNPYYRRAWREYVKSFPPKKKNVFRILFISNSQGYGKEFDADCIISSRMENFLNESGKGKFEVLNLSVGGGQAPEFLFLVGISKKLNPDLLFFSLSPANFGSKVINKRLRDFTSDAPLELYEDVPSTFFPEGFKNKYVDTEFCLSSFFYNNFKSYPISSLILDGLGMKFHKFKRFFNPSLQNRWIFSKKRRGIKERKREEIVIIRRLLKKSEDIDVKMLKDFVYCVKKYKIPAIFLVQPVRKKGYEEYKKYFEKFDAILSKYSSPSFVYIDFSRKIDDKFFFDNVHLTKAGHRVVGKRFSEIVLNWLKLDLKKKFYVLK